MESWERRCENCEPRRKQEGWRERKQRRVMRPKVEDL